MQEFQKYLDAIKNQDFPSLMSLWENQDFFNMQDENGDTLLHHTLRLGNIMIIQMFIGFRADLNIKNNDGITALDLIKQINVPVINAVIEAYSNDNTNYEEDDYEEDDYEEDDIYVTKVYLCRPKNLEQLRELLEDENIPLRNIDTSSITDMSYLFLRSIRRNFDGIETWDTSKVVYMTSMFDDALYFNHNINIWNVSNVKNMSCMFSYAEVFNCDISNWNTSNVIDMFAMFSDCREFNQPLDKWDISKVNHILRMFENAKSFNQNLNNWNISNVYSLQGVFENAVSFNGNISNWYVSNIGNMEKMFLGAESFNQDLNNWNVSNVVGMEYMFYKASSFNKDNIKEWRFNNLKYIHNMFDDIPLYIIFEVYSKLNNKKALEELKEYTLNKDVKEVYLEALKYYDKCVVEFVKIYENTYYDALKELIENKEAFIKENNKLLEKN